MWWRRWRAARDPQRAIREISAALEPAAEATEGASADAALANLDMQKIESALGQYGVSMDDVVGFLDLDEEDTEGEGGGEVSLPSPPTRHVPEFVVMDQTLTMSDSSSVGFVQTRAGQQEVYALRMDRRPHTHDPWWHRHIFGVRRCYLLGKSRSVIGAVRLSTTGKAIVPERPLLPVSRALTGERHPLCECTQAAVGFLFKE